jgi:hypothetical protein
VTKTAYLVLATLLLGCTKATPDATGNAASASAAPSSSSPAIASAAASSSAAPALAFPRSWKGTYKTAAATLAVPSAWSKTHWSSSDATEGVGEGTMTLVIDAATRRISGSVDGAMGAALLDGQLGDGRLSAAIVRKDPTDKGLVGTLQATIAADKVTGTMSLSTGNGGTVRTGTFTLEPEKP